MARPRDAQVPGQCEDVGPSLGSFSVSSFILDQFLEEFAKELKAKKASSTRTRTSGCP